MYILICIYVCFNPLKNVENAWKLNINDLARVEQYEMDRRS